MSLTSIIRRPFIARIPLHCWCPGPYPTDIAHTNNFAQFFISHEIITSACCFRPAIVRIATDFRNRSHENFKHAQNDRRRCESDNVHAALAEIFFALAMQFRCRHCDHISVVPNRDYFISVFSRVCVVDRTCDGKEKKNRNARFHWNRTKMQSQMKAEKWVQFAASR